MEVFYCVYKITNQINNKIYIGIHETYDLEDNYMGSGKYLKMSQNKYGLNNFKKEIISIFDNKKEMLDLERDLVNEEFVLRKDTYNLKIGGEGGWDHLKGFITVKDKAGNIYSVSKTDERFLNGELVAFSKGFVPVKDKEGKTFSVSKTDERYLNGELVHVANGIVSVKDKEGKTYSVSKTDERFLNGEFVGCVKGFISVKNKEGKTFSVSKTDERYLSGEFVPIWSGKKHKKETKLKIGKANSINHKGEKNSQFGKQWIYNLELKISKRILKTEIIPVGWLKGRVLNFDK
jgi:uncharacterized cupin superfamily protein